MREEDVANFHEVTNKIEKQRSKKESWFKGDRASFMLFSHYLDKIELTSNGIKRRELVL
jgi:hypothetical protein